MACPLGVLIAGKPDKTLDDCSKKLLVAHDIIDVLNGKWKMEVILVLLQFEKRRFNELKDNISGISAKVLSSVLKDLEVNLIVTKESIDDDLVITEYKLTDYGKSLKQPIADFVTLGIEHRKKIMGH